MNKLEFHFAYLLIHMSAANSLSINSKPLLGLTSKNYAKKNRYLMNSASRHHDTNDLFIGSLGNQQIGVLNKHLAKLAELHALHQKTRTRIDDAGVEIAALLANFGNIIKPSIDLQPIQDELLAGLEFPDLLSRIAARRIHESMTISFPEELIDEILELFLRGKVQEVYVDVVDTLNGIVSDLNPILGSLNLSLIPPVELDPNNYEYPLHFVQLPPAFGERFPLNKQFATYSEIDSARDNSFGTFINFLLSRNINKHDAAAVSPSLSALFGLVETNRYD